MAVASRRRFLRISVAFGAVGALATIDSARALARGMAGGGLPRRRVSFLKPDGEVVCWCPIDSEWLTAAYRAAIRLGLRCVVSQ